MCSQTKTNKSTVSCSAETLCAARVIREADRLLIGIGSGMTAAGGLNYADHALVDKWYPEWAARGKRTILDIMGMFWPSTLTEKNAPAFWAFWARHIWHIRHEPGALSPYTKSWCKPISGNDALALAAMKYALRMGIDTLVPPGDFEHFHFAMEHIDDCLQNPLSTQGDELLRAELVHVAGYEFLYTRRLYPQVGQ